MFSIKRQLQISITLIALALIFLISGLTLFWVNRTFNQNRLEVASSYLLENAAFMDEAIAEIALPANLIGTQVNTHYEEIKASGRALDISAWLPYLNTALTYRDLPQNLIGHIDLYTIDSTGQLSAISAHYETAPQGNRLLSGKAHSQPLEADLSKALNLMLQNGTSSFWLTGPAGGPTGNESKVWSQLRVFRYYNQPVLAAALSGDASSFKIAAEMNRLDTAPSLALLSQSNSLIYASDAFDPQMLKSVSSSITVKDKASGQTILISRRADGPQLVLSHVLSNTWQLVYIYTPKHWLSVMTQALGPLMILIVLFVLLLILLGNWAFRRFDQPLHRLENLLRLQTNDARQSFPVPKSRHESRDEIYQLMDAYQQLSRYIEHSENDLRALKVTLEAQSQLKSRELQQTNALLSASIADLERQSTHLETLHEKLSQNINAINESRRELLNLEKMSSLKYLVSGVAHELNTPIGNAITIATYLDAEIDFMLKQLKQGQQLQKHKLTDSVKTIRTSLQQLLNNLQQGQLILTLIQDLVISEDEALLVPVEVPAFLKLIAETYMAHQQPQADLSLRATLPHDYLLTDPDKLRQILIPLLENSYVHGFRDMKESPMIQIGLYAERGHLVLEYGDNGKGVDWKDKQHILTPFYSSDFGLRKGLGLNFAYNIVTQYYKGHLSFFDTPLGGLGVRCELETAQLIDLSQNAEGEVSR